MLSHIERARNLLLKGRFTRSVHKTMTHLEKIAEQKTEKVDGKLYDYMFDPVENQIVLVHQDQKRLYHFITFMKTDYNYEGQSAFRWASTDKSKGDLFM